MGRGFPSALQHLLHCGIRPDVVYDVGAAVGTPWLYAAFPQAHFVLVEPLPQHLELLRPLAQTLDAEVHACAAGAVEGNCTLLRYARSSRSSLHPPTRIEQELAAHRGVSLQATAIEVPMLPLDRLYRPGNAVLKIDVEGAERAVLDGATRVLGQVQLLIIELSIYPRTEGEASFAEMIGELDARGFRLFDIAELSYPIPERELAYLDALFVPHRLDPTGAWLANRAGTA
ncbi:MAG: FkbM family methyltransferase [Xanthomonadales bacterium]|jgi:FkbM family methyltransferase|nr:FkbM family methyltransferase [Xanthomonadales bacterium]